MEQVMLWPPNSMPVPLGSTLKIEAAPEAPAQVVVDDLFPKGSICRYFSNQEYGLIKDRSGREVVFKISEMDFVGAKGRGDIKEGAIVGYDLEHAGRELRIRKMKVY